MITEQQQKTIDSFASGTARALYEISLTMGDSRWALDARAAAYRTEAAWRRAGATL